jgi:hypothetical protein
LFFGACAVFPSLTKPGEVPVFLQMWDVNDARTGTPETRDRAMIVPDGSSVPGTDTNATDLSYAAAMWQQMLYDMIVSKMSVTAAVNDANATIQPIWPHPANTPPPPKFIVYGNPNVKLR